jgi:hypothetical protein
MNMAATEMLAVFNIGLLLSSAGEFFSFQSDFKHYSNAICPQG